MTTDLRKKIAYMAVLIASAVLFVHALVPHHHRVQDLAVCTEASGACNHSSALPVTSSGMILSEASCDCTCQGGVGCTPTLPFMLKHNADGGTYDDLLLSCVLPALVTDIVLPEPPVLASCIHGSLYPYTYSLFSDYIADGLPRRAPPVLA